MKKTLIAIASVVMTVSASQAQILLDVNFASGYTNGNLIGPLNTAADTIGQGGWAQTGVFTGGNPITIISGQAILTSGATGQDAWKAFESAATMTEGTSLVSKINFSVTSAASGDYFFHLGSPAGSTSNFYQRLFAKSTTGGFLLGISAGSTTGIYGTSLLSLNTAYDVVIAWNSITGPLNDTLNVYVNPTDPTLANNSAYTSTTTWAVAEPSTLDAANLRIGSATKTPGVQVNTINVAIVPEPSSGALLVLGGMALVAVRSLRKKNS